MIIKNSKNSVYLIYNLAEMSFYVGIIISMNSVCLSSKLVGLNS